MRYPVITMVSLNLDFKYFLRNLKYNISRKEFAIGPRGNYSSHFKGEGIDFFGFRQFGYDDDASMIDKIASARSDKILVREFVQEKSLHFIVMLDTSSTMLMTSKEKLKCEYAAEVAAAISFSVAHSGNNIGLCIFNDGVKKLMPSRRGMLQYHKIAVELHKEEYYGGIKRYNESFTYVMNAIKKKSVLFLISDFLNFGKDNEDFLKSLCGKFEIVGIMVRDPAERAMPKVGLVCLEDPRTSEKLLINSSQVSKEYSIESKRQEDEVKNIFLGNNLFFHSILTSQDINDALTRMYAIEGKTWK